MPKISVVMPVYNGERYLKEAVDSVLGQTFSDFELIIVDDGSTDKTAEIVHSYSDNRIIYLKNEVNSGISKTLNYGISVAKGKYIARMDADDICAPQRFEKQFAYMETHQNIAVLASAVELFGEGVNPKTLTFSNNYEDIKVDMLFSSPFAHPSVMMKSSLFDVYQYDSAYNGLEDYVLFWQIAQKFPIATVSDVLLRYRIHAHQVTANYNEQYYKKMLSFKKTQIADIGVDFTQRELDVFVNSSCLPGDYFGIEYCDIAEVYKKLLKCDSIINKNKLSHVLTLKLIGFSKDFCVPNSVLKSSINSGFSKSQLYKHNVVAMLKKVYHSVLTARERRATRAKRNKLNTENFTIISNNCYAGFVYQKFGIEYQTPTIGLYILSHDYVKFCSKLEHYLNQPLVFIEFQKSSHYEEIKGKHKPFPVAMLDDIEIYFMHYKTASEARLKWDRRCKRICKDKIIYKYSMRDGATVEDAEQFLKLDVENKLCFLPYEAEGAVFIPNISDVVGDETKLIDKYFDITEYLRSI